MSQPGAPRAFCLKATYCCMYTLCTVLPKEEGQESGKEIRTDPVAGDSLKQEYIFVIPTTVVNLYLISEGTGDQEAEHGDNGSDSESISIQQNIQMALMYEVRGVGSNMDPTNELVGIQKSQQSFANDYCKQLYVCTLLSQIPSREASSSGVIKVLSLLETWFCQAIENYLCVKLRFIVIDLEAHIWAQKVNLSICHEGYNCHRNKSAQDLSIFSLYVSL